MCGGTHRFRAMRTTDGGLSPRVRGNQGKKRYTGTAQGSIPACAGEPFRRDSLAGQPEVYPACAGEPQHDAVPAALIGVYPRVCGGTKFRFRAWPRA